MCLVACSLFGIIAQVEVVVKREYYSFNDSYSFLFFSYSQVSYLLHILLINFLNIFPFEPTVSIIDMIDIPIKAPKAIVF